MFNLALLEITCVSEFGPNYRQEGSNPSTHFCWLFLQQLEEAISDYCRICHRPNSFWSPNVESHPIIDADLDQTIKDVILLPNVIVDQFKQHLHSQSPDGVIIVVIVELDLVLGMHALNNLAAKRLAYLKADTNLHQYTCSGVGYLLPRRWPSLCLRESKCIIHSSPQLLEKHALRHSERPQRTNKSIGQQSRGKDIVKRV